MRVDGLCELWAVMGNEGLGGFRDVRNLLSLENARTARDEMISSAPDSLVSLCGGDREGNGLGNLHAAR